MSSWRRIARLLFAPGDGFARDSLPAGAVRAWTDMQIVSHAAFVPAIAVAALRQPPLPELAALQAATLALSLAYHRNYERPGRLSKLEGSTAKTLFAYGAAQTYLSPTPECLAVSAGSLRQAAELVDRLLQRGPAPRRAGLVRIRGQDTDDRDRR